MVIPCNLWFFNICVDWEIDIFGWVFNLPQGVRPPGPPPSITFPSELSVTFHVRGTLPPWPALTIGPDRIPTFEPKPTNEPDGQCETESAELCLTSTSFGVDGATVTTTSAVLSTCATVFGCNVEDSSTSTTTTSASASYQYCSAGAAAGARRRWLTTTSNTAPTQTSSPIKERNLSLVARELSLSKREIPSFESADGAGDFYDIVRESGNTQVVPQDEAQFGRSTSIFQAFDNADHNVVVDRLYGCTSVVVVSRLGAYVTHFWERPAFNIVTDGRNPLQDNVLNYFDFGRTGEANTEALAALIGRGVFGDDTNTRICIMTPAIRARDLTQSTPPTEQADSIPLSEPRGLYDIDDVNGSNPEVRALIPRVKDKLAQLLPNVQQDQFTYRRNNNGASGAYGAAVAVYSNDQTENPDDPLVDLDPPNQAIWQCWMQGKEMGRDIWGPLPGQGAPPPEPTATDGTAGPSPTATTAPEPTTTISPGSSSITITDLPTMTFTTDIITPSGSSCVAAGFQTNRAQGPGGAGTACATTPVCTSFVNTETTAPPPPPEPTSEPQPTSPPLPNPAGGEPGEFCNPDFRLTDCNRDNPLLLNCYCGDPAVGRVWQGTPCEGGVATCHLSTSINDCGPGFEACC